jgi:hypothetical protein
MIQPKVRLLLQTSKPSLVPVDFIVDPGCGITSMPRILAEDRGILIPGKDSIRRINVRSSTGSGVQRVRYGRIGVRVPGLASQNFGMVQTRVTLGGVKPRGLLAERPCPDIVWGGNSTAAPRKKCYPGSEPFEPGQNFYWNCHFVEPPHAPYTVLIGLRLIFDGTYSLEHPYGQLILELTKTPSTP